MATLTTRRTKPDPNLMYEAAQSYADRRGHVYQAGETRLGAHEAVREAPGQWVLASLPDDEKAKARSHAAWDAVVADDASRASVTTPPVAKPPAGLFRATGSWTLQDADLQHRARLNTGDLVDASDLVYRRYPHLFEPVR
jgi:hypothetical protein